MLELTAAKRVRGEVVKRKRMSRVVVGGDPQLIVRGGRQAGHAENSLRRLNAVWHETPLEITESDASKCSLQKYQLKISISYVFCKNIQL